MQDSGREHMSYNHILEKSWCQCWCSSFMMLLLLCQDALGITQKAYLPSVPGFGSTWSNPCTPHLIFLSCNISFLVLGPKVFTVSLSSNSFPDLPWLPGCLFQMFPCEEVLSCSSHAVAPAQMKGPEEGLHR